jgi:GNAT superfamily N-acetyltransferase
MEMHVDVVVVEESQIAPEQKEEMLRLQVACFADQVTAKEVEEDFVSPLVARVLAYREGALIGCAGVFNREVQYAGQSVVLGRFGPCTREDLRGRGIGTLVCRAAMDYLRAEGCDIAFLSVDPERETHALHERLGFKILSQPFTYANLQGELTQSEGGMIAPLCSRELFERVLGGDAPFALTPEPGCW